MSDVVSSISLDDTSSNITYAGASWVHESNTPSYKNLYDSTETYNEGETGATASLYFYGTALEYWGNLWNNHGPCAISLDNTLIGTITAYTPDPSGVPSSLLYSTNDLALGDHTFVIQVMGTTQGSSNCEVDRFVVNITAPEPTSTTSASIPSSIFSSFTSSSSTSSSSTTPVAIPTKSPTSKSSSSIGVIVGGVLGGTVIGILLAILLWLCMNRRDKRQDGNRNPHPDVPAAPPPVSQMGMRNPNSYYNYVPPPPEFGYNPYSNYPHDPLPMSVSPSALTTDTNTATGSPLPDKTEYGRTSTSTSAKAPAVVPAEAPSLTQDPPPYEKPRTYM